MCLISLVEEGRGGGICALRQPLQDLHRTNAEGGGGAAAAAVAVAAAGINTGVIQVPVEYEGPLPTV